MCIKNKPLKETLENFYIHQELSPSVISKMYNCDPSTIRVWLKNYGIPLRSLKESHNTSRIKKIKSESILGNKNPAKRTDVKKKMCDNHWLKSGSIKAFNFIELYIKPRMNSENNPMKNPEIAKLHGEQMEGDSNPSKRPEVREKLRVSRVNQKFPIKNTSIELKMQQILTDNNYQFQTQVSLLNLCIPDIVFPNKKIIIQCDGDYWHDYPNGLKKDYYQDEILTKNGYTVLRFWEHEINENIEDCLHRFELKYYGGKC